MVTTYRTSTVFLEAGRDFADPERAAFAWSEIEALGPQSPTVVLNCYGVETVPPLCADVVRALAGLPRPPRVVVTEASYPVVAEMERLRHALEARISHAARPFLPHPAGRTATALGQRWVREPQRSVGRILDSSSASSVLVGSSSSPA